MARRAPTLLALVALLGLAPRSAPAQRVSAEPPAVRVVRAVLRNTRDPRYDHVTRVDEPRGVYHFDCSGMVRWVLDSATPRAEASLERGLGTRRPLARDYHRWNASLPEGRPRGHWLRVARASELQPGDVLAWTFPPRFRLAITGHVVLVMNRPRRVSARRLRVQIADSTRNPHDDDTRSRRGTSGPGLGWIDLEYDPRTGALTGYQWSHRPGAGLLRVPINAGRPLE
ncbi:MAG: hypothetical protein HY909_07415 [Deltaproteobacteria bacterium]|nr:hypothetical protein [Deltaproteobacteria bacterium]